LHDEALLRTYEAQREESELLRTRIAELRETAGTLKQQTMRLSQRLPPI
jgi:hypothetical protein